MKLFFMLFLLMEVYSNGILQKIHQRRVRITYEQKDLAKDDQKQNAHVKKHVAKLFVLLVDLLLLFGIMRIHALIICGIVHILRFPPS